MRHKLISAMLCMTLATSCVDMDIAPKNIVTSESLLSNESGMDIYMARLYSNMPWEDFKYLSQWGVNFNGWRLSPCKRNSIFSDYPFLRIYTFQIGIQIIVQ